MFAFALRPPTLPVTAAASVPWLDFAEIRVNRVDTLEKCLAEFPRGATAATAWPLLAVQVTFELSQLLAEGGPSFRRAQYARAWRLGTCVPDAVARLARRSLLLPLAATWDGRPAVGFELCERMSPVRDATRLKKMRVRPLRTYLLFVADGGFVPDGSGRPWQKVEAGPNSIRPLARRARAATAAA